MWRRVCVAPRRSALAKPHPSVAALRGRALSPFPPSSPSPKPAVFFSSVPGDGSLNKRLEDVMPIATGLEREEIQAELEEAPAVIQSYYDKRIVGCPGGRGDEHDVVWFWLEKGKPHECPVCSQYFVLEVIGEGGPPDGHGDEDDH
ncbi:hypothetical protein BHE74_00025414 [Ensete ventricosum]|nr:hypothetical protein GW17_00016477 [Ensete ventricosum]RWW67159.1 hypothetical protein BHE74_00025414 [Ensete ventricosum]